GFPNDFAHPTKKAQPDWGHKVATAIWGVTEHSSQGNWKWRNERFYLNEKLAQGLQGEDIYKPKVDSVDGEGQTKSYVHMFWKETSPLPKYIRTVVNLLTERDYQPVATALDPTSSTERSRHWA